mmetsp:Transcript_52644/g.132410  ORF Transcript_52644/g.132410 Transcript_52644/m.132410 type:complete len:227 (-) Transcript_52644:739-1419(-)
MRTFMRSVRVMTPMIFLVPGYTTGTSRTLRFAMMSLMTWKMSSCGSTHTHSAVSTHSLMVCAPMPCRSARSSVRRSTTPTTSSPSTMGTALRCSSIIFWCHVTSVSRTSAAMAGCVMWSLTLSGSPSCVISIATMTSLASSMPASRTVAAAASLCPPPPKCSHTRATSTRGVRLRATMDTWSASMATRKKTTGRCVFTMRSTTRESPFTFWSLWNSEKVTRTPAMV